VILLKFLQFESYEAFLVRNFCREPGQLKNCQVVHRRHYYNFFFFCIFILVFYIFKKDERCTESITNVNTQWRLVLCYSSFLYYYSRSWDGLPSRNKNPLRKKCVINWSRKIVSQLKEICSWSFFTHSTCV